MSQFDYIWQAITPYIEFFFNFGVIICGFYAIWVLFSALTK
jgi:hypothetical protein